ncbi:MAG: MFS transporter [Bacteroidaceae bacterium]|nr:MFS transporter [Bacteroidaceae bacterium]
MKKYYPWVVVALLSVVALLNYLDRQMLSTMQASMSADFAELRNAEMFGVLMAAFMWVYAFVSPFAGVVADSVSRKWLIVCSLAVWSAVTCLMGYAETFEQLWWLRAVMGISEALYIPSALSLIADWHRGGSRSLAVGIHMTGLYVGQALGGFGAMMADSLSWQVTFQTLGFFGVAYAVVLMLLLRENRAEAASASSKNSSEGKFMPIIRGVTLVCGSLPFWVILCVFAIPSLPGWATKNWLPSLFAESLGMTMSEIGPIATISLAASSFAGAFLGGYVSDRWARVNVRGRVYTSAIGLGLTLPGLVLLGFGSGMPAVVGAVVLFGVGFGMFDTNNMPILCQFIPSRGRATAYGLMNMTGVLFGAVATQLMGSLPSLGVGFACMAGAVAVAIGLQLGCLRPEVDNME